MKLNKKIQFGLLTVISSLPIVFILNYENKEKKIITINPKNLTNTKENIYDINNYLNNDYYIVWENNLHNEQVEKIIKTNYEDIERKITKK